MRTPAASPYNVGNYSVQQGVPMNYKLALILTLALFAGIFVLQNTTVVEFRFLFWSASMSRSLMFFLLIAVGIAVGWLLHGHMRSRTSRK